MEGKSLYLNWGGLIVLYKVTSDSYLTYEESAEVVVVKTTSEN